eukprot:PITA_34886
MGVFSASTTLLTFKWFGLSVALLLLLHWGIPSVHGHEDNMYGGGVQQQMRFCDPERLSDCRDYLQRRREQPSERCCNELQKMSPQCRCQSIQRVLDQSQSSDSTTKDLFMDSDSQEDAPLDQRRRGREGRGREGQEEAVHRAEHLPNTCNVHQPPRRCDIQCRSRYIMTGSSFKAPTVHR